MLGIMCQKGATLRWRHPQRSNLALAVEGLGALSQMRSILLDIFEQEMVVVTGQPPGESESFGHLRHLQGGDLPHLFLHFKILSYIYIYTHNNLKATVNHYIYIYTYIPWYSCNFPIIEIFGVYYSSYSHNILVIIPKSSIIAMKISTNIH